MRLFLLPITKSRTLLYCQRLHVTTTDKPNLVDKLTVRAAKLWAGWEKKDSGWQRKVVDYGNMALKRIPYEEWGLKSVPSLTTRKKDKELEGKRKIELIYPQSVIPKDRVESILSSLATERDSLHRRRLIWCIIGMPISAPFALVPVIPNLPFFYLVYRAWSHWRALAGSNHLRFLVKNKLLDLSPSKKLDQVYTPLLPAAPIKPSKAANGDKVGESNEVAGEKVILSQKDGKKIVDVLDLPELEVEMERAIWQIERAKKAEQEAQKQNAPGQTPTRNENSKTTQTKKEKKK
ncbi:hypothetical protein HYQ45_011273 [Verticillium longisporum]|uniref:Mitochondrial K+-H+ exchange-related-domain-containing protein n=3 Tax=Verticillium TaxID=1036719 RepID=G2XG34_VERDV|nr:uncharacterized protein VDAG_09013 [Verticillium dahliae VdLs.17]KAF3343274.1 Prefoldin subunit 6 [Verticillium dahliae VDG2]KAF3360924.1 Serine/threonine-protein kinase KIN2 [Verticillium dahliae VDG1]KAG7129681.1 hypothetical protein HYQ45_011273 [Verticillium longisporum]KAH6702556.1 mitochondrial K+-H+ exchange-related-domain-containing protein [Verticillium dahliae]EGY18853.1 hypothetical protein VDAG_09013 [Verticillium dahliae VdLs.17]